MPVFLANRGKSARDEAPLPDISPVLNDNSWEIIQFAAQNGIAPNYWSVGDVKMVHIQGTVGILELDGEYGCFILGFDHNSSIEGENTIHFGFGKTADGVDIAFVDSNYFTAENENGFIMKPASSVAYRWSNCHMRNTICAEFLTALPSELQNIIGICNKYTQYSGESTNSVITEDTIFLLSPREMYASTINFGSTAERDYLQQYTYYKNGNSKAKYRHDDNSTSCAYWLRTPKDDTIARCTCVTAGGGFSDITGDVSDASLGFTPAFMIA